MFLVKKELTVLFVAAESGPYGSTLKRSLKVIITGSRGIACGAAVLRFDPAILAQIFQNVLHHKFIVRWTPVLSNRFDSTAFKKVYGDLYKAFTKQTASRRFTVSC